MQYYTQFWNKIYNITNLNNKNQEMYKHPFYLRHPLLLHYKQEIAYNFLVHHCGIHYEIVKYLLNRRLILSGYTYKHIPIIAFIQRIPATKAIAQHLTIPNPTYKNTLAHDINLAKQKFPQQGTQDEEPIGVDYLYLAPTHYTYYTKHNQRHQLLEINLLKGYKGFQEYRVLKGNSFNLRIGQYPKKVIFTTNPLESICYLQLHLTQHYMQQNTLIVSLLNNNQNVSSILKRNSLYHKINQVTFAPNHQLITQRAISRCSHDKENIKIVYPKGYRTWLQALQQQEFNNKHNLFIDNVLNNQQNIHLLNLGLTNFLGEYNTQCFSLMLHVLAQSYKKKITHKYEPLNTTNIRIQSYQVIKQKLPKRKVYFIEQYLKNVGYYHSPIEVDRWFKKMFFQHYHKRNSLLYTQTLKYIDTLQYHTSKDMIKSLRKQGKQMLQASISRQQHLNVHHYRSKSDKQIHIRRDSTSHYANPHRNYQLKYNHNFDENR